ncbi:MAG TPA: PilC/PilY family type IV pilus protein [Pseudomonadales bacterium]|nr:PilC/PilY family type IV pilus protein [Pseudomonadales bacterium]
MSKERAFQLSRDGRIAVCAIVFALGTAWAYDAFIPDAQPVGWLAQPTVSNFEVSSGAETLYSIAFDPADWSGNVFAFPVSANGTVNQQLDRFAGGAAAQLDTQNFDTGRRIVTMHKSGNGIPFRWNALDPTQQAAIGNATDGPKILDYLRGDRSNEGAGLDLRPRNTVLGDIIHARPLYVAGNGNPVLYVGANDGMLHAFDADTGKEQWAYIPSMLIPKLRLLAPQAIFAYSHAHFVDASPAAKTIAISDTVDKTILVGGLGAGGRGLYALDITSDGTTPATSETQAKTRVRWEITPTSRTGASTTDFANLGYTYGVPTIARSNSGAPVVIMPNGYQSTAGRASLFVIHAWNATLVREIDTGAGSVTSPNGLSAIASVDLDFNGTVDYVFAGDLDGTLWKFDLTSATPSEWSVAAVHQTDPAQSIIAPPAVSLHPDGGFMINFATGVLFTDADSADATTVYYAYGIREAATGTTFTEQTLTDEVYGTGDLAQDVRTISANKPHPLFDRGWRVPLPAGERVVGDSGFIKSGRYYFVATNPAINRATPPSGDNWLYELDYVTGGSAGVTPFFDLNADGVLDSDDRLTDNQGDPIFDDSGVPIAKRIARGVLSQPILIQLGTLNTTKFSQNDNTVVGVAEIPGGVAGGHFDYDIYHALGSMRNQKHRHEYDDTYGVTGVNMLNASEPAFNLSNVDSLRGDRVVTGDCGDAGVVDDGKKAKKDKKDKGGDGGGSTGCVSEVATAEFKVLAMNQYLNPAVLLRVGDEPAFSSVRVWRGQASATTAEEVLAPESTPVYTADTIAQLIFNLPQDAFLSKDWWGDGILRAGLMPTQTGCVNDVDEEGFDDNPGKFGERHNGAFTLQLIRADTPASALTLNYPAGGPKYGWMVRQGADFERYVHAEYTAFWHHGNKACYGDADWTPTPAPEFDLPTNKTPPSGTDDPRGVFGGDIENPPVKVNSKTVNNVTTVEVTYKDGTKVTTVITDTGGGGRTINITDGGVSTDIDISGGQVLDGADESRSSTRGGRLMWRKL